MKFNTVRAQQDEMLQADLTAQSWDTPSAHSTSALELSDAELDAVYGGAYVYDRDHIRNIHSYSVICDINIFSLNVNVLNIVSIATSTKQVCINKD